MEVKCHHHVKYIHETLYSRQLWYVWTSPNHWMRLVTVNVPFPVFIYLFVYLFICNLLIPLMGRIEWSFSLKLTVTSSFILLPQNLLKNNVPLLLVEILQNYTGSFPASRFFKSSSFIKGFRFFIILVVIYYNNTSIYYNTSKYTSNTILPYLCLQFKINTFVSILVFCTSNWTYKSSEIS